ncbi:MAG TPA: hypothetical protein VJ853_03270 [Thermoanaerobaculia bacterium]|nr:hypothetical protein [Thermoanaerobaculia bacterium]
MTTISDDYMRENLAKTKAYSAVILKSTAKAAQPEARPIIWEHGRRNFQLRADGVLSIVCPISDGSGVSGIGIFNASVDETERIMRDDPGVQAGLFTFEVHACRSFPGDALP